jgi:hypothetical protein
LTGWVCGKRRQRDYGKTTRQKTGTISSRWITEMDPDDLSAIRATFERLVACGCADEALCAPMI